MALKKSILQTIKDNRLKAVSFFAILGDVLIGGAGTFGLLMRGAEVSGGYSFLLVAGLLAFIGHLALLIWGKGGDKSSRKAGTPHLPFYARPFLPISYPLDFAFALWSIAGFMYLISGTLLNEVSLFVVGLANMAASLIGWLIPEKARWKGLNSVQLSSLCFFVSTFSTFISAYMLSDIFLLLSSCAYAACNLTLFSVQKANQSGNA